MTKKNKALLIGLLIIMAASMFRVAWFSKWRQIVPVSVASTALASRGSNISNIGLLDLFEWESASVYSNKEEFQANCRPPQHVPDTCCLGSISRGGNVERYPVCNQTLQEYRMVQKLAENTLHSGMMDCDVCRILELAHENKVNISWWGDSLHNQLWDGFRCELTRRNYKIVNETTQLILPLTRCQGMFCLTHIYTLFVQAEHWQDSLAVKFFFQYRPKETVDILYNESLSFILPETDVLFFNFGVHWPITYQSVYYMRIKVVLQALQFYKDQLDLVVYRENTAQHFNTTGGEFTFGSNDKFWGATCRPIADNDTLVGWREEYFQKTAQDLNYTLVFADPSLLKIANPVSNDDLVIVPFERFTRQLWFLHPSECTHFCSTPHLWSPIWRSLRLAMEWNYG